MKTLTGISILLLSCLFIVLCGNHVNAKISENIYFQSMLMDSNATVATDGEYTVTFSIWDGEYETDHKLWEEQHTVLVEDGTYSVSLGSIVSFLDPDQNGDQSDALTFAIPYYLGVKIDNDDYLKFDDKFPGFRSVITAFRSSTSAGNLVRSVSSSYTITEQDDVVFVSGNAQITLPSAYNVYGRIITIKNVDSTHAISIVTVNSETINTINCDISNSGTAFTLPHQNDDLTVISNGQNWISLGFRNDLLENYYTKDDLDQKFNANDITINSIQTTITQKAGYSEIYTRNTLDFILNSKASITETVNLCQNTNSNRKPNALSLADYETTPPSTNEGDIYILCKSDGEFISGTLDGNWGSVSPGDMVIYLEGQWKRIDNISPKEGWTVYIEDSNQLAIFAEGTSYSVWAIGNIGSPVDENSNDLTKNKLVSNNMMKQLMTHMDSDHSGVISLIVDKAFVENVLTGEISSHTHPQSISTKPMPSVTGGGGVFSYEIQQMVDKYDIYPNDLLTDNSGGYAIVTTHEMIQNETTIIPEMTSNTQPYGEISGTNKNSNTATDFYMVFDGNFTNKWWSSSGDEGYIQYTFVDKKQIGKIAITADSVWYDRCPTDFKLYAFNETFDSENILLDISGITWTTGERKTFEFTNSSQYYTYRIHMTSKQGSWGLSGEYSISEIEMFPALSQIIGNIYCSGDNIQPTSILSPADFTEFEFLSFNISTGLIESEKGFQYTWPFKDSKILKMDCMSNDSADINGMINGNPIFQNPIQTGNGIAYSGLVIEDANSISYGDVLDISSNSSGNNLFVRIWFINM